MENRVFGHNLLQNKELIAFYWWINFLSSRGAEPVVFTLVFAGVRRFHLQFELNPKKQGFSISSAAGLEAAG